MDGYGGSVGTTSETAKEEARLQVNAEAGWLQGLVGKGSPRACAGEESGHLQEPEKNPRSQRDPTDLCLPLWNTATAR